MPKEENNRAIRELYDVLLQLKTPEDCEILLRDLCTHKEVENMAARIASARLLMQGETYTEIMRQTGISSATLARVSSAVQYGSGYRKFVAPDSPKRSSEGR